VRDGTVERQAAGYGSEGAHLESTPRAPRRRDVAGIARLVPVAVLAIATGLGAGVLFGGLVSIDQDFLVLVAGGIGAAALLLLAAIRFEWFVWVVLALRTSLDMVAGPGLGAGAMLASVFLCLAAVWLVVQHRSGHWVPLSIASKALLALAGSGALSLLTSAIPGATAVGVLEVLAGALMFLVLEQLLAGRPDRLRRLLVAVFASMAIPVLVGLQQLLTGQSYGHRVDVGRIHGSFVHPNPYATYLVSMLVLTVGLALATRGLRRYGLVALSGVLGVLLVSTYARAAWAALVVALVYLGFRMSRRLLLAMGIALVGVALFVPSVTARLADLGGEPDRYLPVGVPRNSFEWRVQYWESLLPLAADSPMTGVGLRTVPLLSPERLEPHNIFVQAIVEIGFLGLAALVFVMVATAVTLRRRRLAAEGDQAGTLAVIAIAAGLALLVQAPTENILTQAMAYWYTAAVATWGYVRWRSPAASASEGPAARAADPQAAPA
jgi:putative inorganic carbon (hco3(-)) transporter